MSRRNVSEEFLSNALDKLQQSVTVSIATEVKRSIEALKETILNNLIEENKALLQKVKILESEISSISDRLYYLESNQVDQQQRSRRNNLELHGIPNVVDDNELEETVVDLLNKIAVTPINRNEIDACHRLQRKSGIIPVIIRFLCRKRRDELYGNRMKYKGMNLDEKGIKNLYLNENYTKEIKKLSYQCRKLKRDNKLAKLSTENGRNKVNFSLTETQWTFANHETD